MLWWHIGELSGAQWFSHLDLLRGYWQINAAEQDRKLSFGLTNAPACFMRAMHLILKGFCWSDCLVYLDDIIIFGHILDSDASDSGLGVLLPQVQSGVEHVIAYAARALSKAERNYSTTWKELLALVWATEHFKTFLYVQNFLATTDHSALQWLRNFKNPKCQVARWLEWLSDFDFEVEQGQLHGNVDGLSSLPWDEDAWVKDRRNATLIQSVNILSRT